jgi:DNA-binding response OmpR family regulator
MTTKAVPSPTPTPSEQVSYVPRDRPTRFHTLVAGLDSDTEQLVSRALVASGIEVLISTNVFDALFDGDSDSGDEFGCLVLGEDLEQVSYLRSIGMQYPILTLLKDPGARARVMALEVGSDDCLGPRFAAAELVARVHSLSRRRGSVSLSDAVTVGELSLSVEAYTVTFNGNTLILTPTETEILQILMESCGRIVSSSQIGRAVWGESAESRPNLVSVHLSNLRRKLVTSLGTKNKIVTLRSRGYMLTG